jgi:hypothetical protein
VKVGTKVGVLVCFAVWCAAMVLPDQLFWGDGRWLFGYRLARASVEHLGHDGDAWLLAGPANLAMALGWLLIPVRAGTARWFLAAGGVIALWPALWGIWLDPVLAVAWCGSCLLGARVLWLDTDT